jgi:flagellar protein FliS
MPDMVGAGFQTYRKTDVVTADPKKLVIMCYEGALHSLRTARAKYADQEYEAKAKAIQNALDILNELRAALDFEKGGGIAHNLESLYSFWITHIMKADQHRDLHALDQVATMLEEIKAALEEAYFGTQEGETLPLPLGEPGSRSTKENPPFPAPRY